MGRTVGVGWLVTGASLASVLACVAALGALIALDAPIAVTIGGGIALGGLASLAVISSRALGRAIRSATRNANALADAEERQLVPGAGLVPMELRIIERALQHASTQLRDRRGYVAEFASNVTHELKTPLTAIRGAAELLLEQREKMSDEQFDRFVRNIDADAERMERMVSRLLDLARVGNPLPNSVQQIETAPFFRELVERYDTVELNLDAPPERIAINTVQLRSAVSNLLDNAVRHGDGKPVDLRVSTDPHQADRLRIQVRDRGPGISVANQRRLFEPFFTTERDRGGTGLGLAIVKAVAENRRGTVSVDTGSDGTEFTLVL